MPKSWNRAETWLTLMAMGVGGVLMAILGVWGYVSATSKPLHPRAEDVPFEAAADPEREWVAAAERGRQILRDGLAEQNLPGLSVAVGVDGHVVWAEGIGWADLEKRVPVAPDTRFRIGTASTVLTSAGAGRLLQEGRLDLDEPIQRYVPAFPSKEWPVTVRQVMAHVAGVRTDSGDEGPLFSQHCERPVDALEFFADRALLFQPGTEYRYSSYGWILVSAAVEAAAREPFLEFMRKQVFEPLGMNHTSPDAATESIPTQATPYFPRFAADPRYGPDLMREVDYSCYAGASVFLSTPSDLVRFGMAINSGTLLTPDTVRQLQAPQRLASGGDTGYGLGWDLETVTVAGEQRQAIGHQGELLGGMVASLMTFPDEGIVVSVLSNISYADTFRLAVQVADVFAERRTARTRN